MKLRQWYRIDARADAPAVVDLHIYDDIGTSWWNDKAVSASAFVADLMALDASVRTIRVHINSLGGSVFEATAIANALREQRQVHHRTVEMLIEGIAASAATIVTSAGAPIRMAENALLMVHDPSTGVWGTSDQLLEAATLLDQVRDTIVTTYQWVSSRSAEELKALMKATTWMTAAEALAHGFVTEIIVDAAPVTAHLRADVVARLGEIPEAFRARVEAMVASPAPPPPPVPMATAAEVLQRCAAASLDVAFAQALTATALPMEEVEARIAAEVTARAVAVERATQIRQVCAMAKLEDLAEGYVSGGMSLEVVRAHLTTLTARLDRVEIDANLPPGGPPAAKRSALDPTAIYAARAAKPHSKE